MEITFASSKTIITVPQVTKTVNSIKIYQLIDQPDIKRVTAFTNEVGRVVLWDGAAYDAIGQWTDTDVVNRINEIYS